MTSVYAAAWRAVTRVLAAAPWPAMTTVKDGPVVFAGCEGDEPQEYVLVVADTDVDQEQTLTYGNPVNGESFSIPVYVYTEVPGRTAWQALDRIEQLTAIAEAALDEFAGRDGQPVELAAFGAIWTRSGVSQRAVRALAAEGFGGFAEIHVSVQLGRTRVNSGA